LVGGKDEAKYLKKKVTARGSGEKKRGNTARRGGGDREKEKKEHPQKKRHCGKRRVATRE